MILASNRWLKHKSLHLSMPINVRFCLYMRCAYKNICIVILYLTRSSVSPNVNRALSCLCLFVHFEIHDSLFICNSLLRFWAVCFVSGWYTWYVVQVISNFISTFPANCVLDNVYTVHMFSFKRSKMINFSGEVIRIKFLFSSIYFLYILFQVF